MTNDLARIDSLDPAALESLVLRGDIAGLSPAQRVGYYTRMCAVLGLDPATQPLAYLKLSGKEVLYVTRGATDRLAAMHSLNREIIDGPRVMDLAGTKLVYAVCRATLPGGRYETATATVPLIDPVNVLMKAETKAKRRATLAILGLGLLDETETETIPGAVVVEPAPARPAVDIGVALGAIAEADSCESVVAAYGAAQAALRAQVSLDDPEAAPHREAALALAASRMVDLGLSLPASKARAVVADDDLAALADELIALRRERGADALVGWWIAHSPAFDPAIVPLAREMAGRLWAGITATADRATVAAAGKRWAAALAAPPAPPPAEEHGLVVALRGHLAAKPEGAAPGTKEHTSQLAAVAASYLKRLPEITDAGREDDALSVVRAELTRRGCAEPDALLAVVAARRKGPAKAE